MSEISIDYDKAIRQANSLKLYAEECARISYKMSCAVYGKMDFWQGAAAEEFYQQIIDWKYEVLSVKKELETVSRMIIKIVQQLREAEQRIQSNL